MLTIDKAIEILTIWHNDPHQFHNPDYPKAAKLGIEALKRVQLHRKDHHSSYPTLLPGEDPK